MQQVSQANLEKSEGSSNEVWLQDSTLVSPFHEEERGVIEALREARSAQGNMNELQLQVHELNWAHEEDKHDNIILERHI